MFRSLMITMVHINYIFLIVKNDIINNIGGERLYGSIYSLDGMTLAYPMMMCGSLVDFSYAPMI